MNNCLIGSKLNNNALSFPHQIALECDGTILTWSELEHNADRVARGLRKIGVKKGDHVAIWSTNSLNYIVTFYALTKLSAVAVLINFSWNEYEVMRALKDTDVSCLIFDSGYSKMSFIDICRKEITHNGVECKCEKLPVLKNIIYMGQDETDYVTLEDIAALSSEAETSEESSPDDTAVIIFTSGTTSIPKGVMLSHASLLFNAEITTKALRVNQNDRFCAILPMFHCFALVTNVLTGLTCGGSLIIPVKDEFKNLPQFIEERGCTVLNAVPTMLIRQISNNNFEDHNLSTLRTGIIGGALYSKEQYIEFCEKFQYESLLSSLGQTEATAAITMVDYDDTLEVKATTVGKIIEGMEGKIIDPVTGDELEIGNTGEICIRGICVMKGYYGNEKLTNNVIDEEGWLHTGDIGMMDAAGNVHLCGRIKEIVIRGGENISLAEVEEAILKNDRVADVKAFGVPDFELGEKICACVVLKNGKNCTEEEIISEASKTLARYKLPSYVFFIDVIPRSETGKVLICKLKDNVKEICEQKNIGIEIV